jgi:H+/Na+-translocating ferredoxin:NAD+ oxidoreductase subunit G
MPVEDAAKNQPGTAPEPANADSPRMIYTLGGLGLVCGILIVAVFQLTLPAIDRNKAEALQKAIFEVLPGAKTKSVFEERGGALVPAEGGGGSGTHYYAGYDASHHLVGIAVVTTGQGFADVLRVIYGYSPQKRAIVGLKVLDSHETPGLGSKIETDPRFLANFEALDVTTTRDSTSIQNPIVLAKHGEKTHPWQVEAITGATISSRAITDILQTSTQLTVPTINRNLPALERGGS